MSVAFDRATLAKLSPRDLKVLIWRQKWLQTARPKQLPPDVTDHGNGTDPDWTEWGLCSGRNFGKTLCGANWIGYEALRDTGPKHNNLSFVIAPTLNDVRYTCFEGPTGLVTILPPEVIADYNKTNLLITLDNGGIIRGFSAEEPERLRGPQAARAWCFIGSTPVRMADGCEKRIDEVRQGDWVLTRKGARRVMAAQRSKNPERRVVIEFGSTSLTCTADHPILVGGAWKAAGEVEIGDRLCVIAACATEGASGTSMTRSLGIMSGRTRASIRSVLCAFIGRFGRTRTDRFQTAGTFTTSTRTSPTTTSRICSVCQWAITFASTRQADRNPKPRSPVCASECSKHGLPSSLSMSSAQFAERLFRAESWVRSRGSTVRMSARSVCGRLDSKVRTALATCAEHLIGRPNALNAIAASDAITTLRWRDPEPSQNATSFARIARQPSGADAPTRDFVGTSAPLRFTTSVVSNVRGCPSNEPVYDLRVEGESEFIAAGAVVHNCDELAAWVSDEDTWKMMMFGLRLGQRPRVVWTTTPKPKDLIRDLVKPKRHRHITTGSSDENRANTPDSYFEQLDQYSGTQLERQERFGEIIDAEEGGVIKRSWIRLWPHERPLPKFEYVIMSLDTAFTEKTIEKKTHNPDPTACGVWGVFWHEEMSQVMLLDAWEEHLGLPELVKRVKREMQLAYGDDLDRPMLKPLIGPARLSSSGRKPDLILIEEKGSGISLRQSLYAERIETHGYNPGLEDKLTRLHLVSDVFARKQVWVPESDNPKRRGQPKTWCEPAIRQWCSFRGPGSIRHDDHVDQTTQCLRFLKDKGLLNYVKKGADERKREADLDETPAPRRYVNPYGV